MLQTEVKGQAVKFVPHDIPCEQVHAFSNNIFFKLERSDTLL